MYGRLYTPDSGYVKEMAKWDRKKRDYITLADGTLEYGMAPNGYEEFPRMLYKAQRHPISGKFEVCMERDFLSADGTRVLLEATQFNTSCQMIVGNESEKERAKANGWRESMAGAMEYHTGEETQKAVGAAVRAFEDRNLSEKARAEATAIESGMDGHVPEIPRQPAKRRGRPRKVSASASA